MINCKLYKQTKGYCGPSAMRMVLSYYDLEKSEEELAELIGARRVGGCEPQQIVQAAKLLGFEAFYRTNSSIDELRKFVSKEIPVIVDWFSPEQNGHYSVVVGFEGDDIVLADPHFGDYNRMPVQQFLNRWFELDSYPPQDSSKFFLREIIVISRAV